MSNNEVFVQVEGVRDIILVHVPKDGSVHDLLHATEEHGVNFGIEESPFTVFIEEGEEAISPDLSLEEAGIHHRGHVHIHRCHRIAVALNFNGREETREFPPSATVGRVKKWAAKAFGLSEVDATEHALQIAGTNDRPDEDVHIGTLVKHPSCRISFDLVPKVRVEG